MLRILAYHRIVDPATAPDVHPGLASATPAEFARQVDFLARLYRPVSLDDVQRAARGVAALPQRAVLVTFDDAYRDFAEVAWPILRRHDVPAVLFVPTAYPDHPERSFWWDRLYRSLQRCEAAAVATPVGPVLARRPAHRKRTLRRLEAWVKSLPQDQAMAAVEDLCERFCPAHGAVLERNGDDPFEWRPRAAMTGRVVHDAARITSGAPGDVLGWDELRQLARDGVAMAPHSQWHPLLTRCSEKRIREEVRGSREDLRRALGDVPPVFSYPAGAYDARAVRILEQEGFQLAFTQDDGHNNLGTVHPLRLRRTDITRRTTLPVLALRLQPWFTHVDRWRHRGRAAASAR